MKVTWAVACFTLMVFTLVSFTGCATAPSRSDFSEERGQVRIPAYADNSLLSVPAVAGTPTQEVEAWYHLGPEDVIRVSVWGNNDLTLDVVVRPDGKISMPLIQDVQAEGLTASSLANSIKGKLSNYLLDPRVSVILLQVNSPKYYVFGNVNKPGMYTLRGELSVLQALAMAGGFTQFASLRSIKLIRNIGGKQEVRDINYYRLIEEGGTGNYLLKSGDTIVVP